MKKIVTVALGLAVAGLLVVCSCTTTKQVKDVQKRNVQESDSDSDGKVSPAEFEAFYAARFKQMDTDADGKMTLEEYVAFRKVRFRERDVNGDQILTEGELIKVEKMDANGDGKVTPGEYVEFFKVVFGKIDKDDDKTMSPEESSAHYQRWFTDMDQDGDGYLIEEEFNWTAEPAEKKTETI